MNRESCPNLRELHCGSLRSEDGFFRYLEGATIVGAAETLAAIRHSLVGVTETADLTEVHAFLQIADWQNQ
jgi:hypothetical protein